LPAFGKANESSFDGAVGKAAGRTRLAQQGSEHQAAITMAATMLRVTTLAIALVALLASPAAAAPKGDGPYTPFPEGNPLQRAVNYVHQLNSRRVPLHARREAARIGVDKLTKGTSVPGTGSTPAAEQALPRAASATGRAGVSGGGGGLTAEALPFALLALVLAAAAIGFELRARRRAARA
jgi:hypothetical protein